MGSVSEYTVRVQGGGTPMHARSGRVLFGGDTTLFVLSLTVRFTPGGRHTQQCKEYGAAVKFFVMLERLEWFNPGDPAALATVMLVKTPMQMRLLLPVLLPGLVLRLVRFIIKL